MLDVQPIRKWPWWLALYRKRCWAPYFFKPHKEFYEKLSKFSSIKRDEEFRKRAIQNLVHNPLVYFRNCVASVGRMLFSYPWSYTPQKLSTYFYLAPNMFIVVLSILCVYPTYMRKELVPFEIFSLILMGFIAFGGSSLINGGERTFRLLVPIISLWIIFTFTRIIKIQIRGWTSTPPVWALRNSPWTVSFTNLHQPWDLNGWPFSLSWVHAPKW